MRVPWKLIQHKHLLSPICSVGVAAVVAVGVVVVLVAVVVVVVAVGVVVVLGAVVIVVPLPRAVPAKPSNHILIV